MLVSKKRRLIGYLVVCGAAAVAYLVFSGMTAVIVFGVGFIGWYVLST
jgi:hypothetical protein